MTHCLLLKPSIRYSFLLDSCELQYCNEKQCTSSDAYLIFMAMIIVQYQIYNNAPLANPTDVFGCILRSWILAGKTVVDKPHETFSMRANSFVIPVWRCKHNAVYTLTFHFTIVGQHSWQWCGLRIKKLCILNAFMC